MGQDLTDAQKRRRVFVADWNHLALIAAVVVTVWALVTALLTIEVLQFPNKLQQSFEQGQSRGRIESAEKMILQLDLRLQAAEVALGIRADVEESVKLEDMEKP